MNISASLITETYGAIITDAGDKVDVVFKPLRNPFPRGVMVGRNAA